MLYGVDGMEEGNYGEEEYEEAYEEEEDMGVPEEGDYDDEEQPMMQ